MAKDAYNEKDQSKLYIPATEASTASSPTSEDWLFIVAVPLEAAAKPGKEELVDTSAGTLLEDCATGLELPLLPRRTEDRGEEATEEEACKDRAAEEETGIE